MWVFILMRIQFFRMPIMVSFQKIIFGKNDLQKNCNFKQFCYLIKSVLLRRDYMYANGATF